MQISNNNSQSFGSIQVNLSRMNRNQMRISNRLFDTLKYNEKYSVLTNKEIQRGNDLDIYILPNKSRGVQVRFMDPYSGNFVREDKKIISADLYSTISEKLEEATDKIIEIYEKIIQGKIARPKENISKFINGETEMSRINPNKHNDLYDEIKAYKNLGYTQEEAEEQAFEEYRSLYHIDNQDADF